MKILIVEDDADIAKLIRSLLERNNYVVDWQKTNLAAIEAMSSVHYDGIILDRSLPDGDGLNVINHMKNCLAEDNRSPIIILSAMGMPDERVEGLEAGAVDYLTKPYEPAELLARLKICLEFKKQRKNPITKLANLEYDTVNQHLSIEGRTLSLPRRELVIFDILMKNLGTVVPHEKIFDALYGYEDIVESSSATSHISKLRKKLKDRQGRVELKVVRHIGYYLKEV